MPDIVAITLANVLLRVLVYEAEHTGLVGRRARIVFSAGFLSSLTTYSGFGVQTALEISEPIALLTIVATNYVLRFAGVLAGNAMVRRLWGGET